MAADVRDSETDTDDQDQVPMKGVEETDDIASYISSSDSRITLNSEISSIPEHENEGVPSHILVQKQMKDVILSQKAAVQQLVRSNIDALNTSKQSFNITFECQEEKIKQLEQSIQNEFVSKELYLQLKKQLQEERDNHCKTKTHLSEICGELASSHQRLSEMKTSMKQDREVYNSGTDVLNDKIADLQERNSKLQFLLEEKSLACEEMKDQILKQTVKVEELSKKHEEQKVKFKQKVTEADVARQQEAYLHRMMSEKRMKKEKH